MGDVASGFIESIATSNSGHEGIDRFEKSGIALFSNEGRHALQNGMSEGKSRRAGTNLLGRDNRWGSMGGCEPGGDSPICGRVIFAGFFSEAEVGKKYECTSWNNPAVQLQ